MMHQWTFFIAIIIWLSFSCSFLSRVNFLCSWKTTRKVSLVEIAHSFHVEKAVAAAMWWANDGKWCLKTFPSTTINLDHEYRWTILRERTRRVVFAIAKKLTLGKFSLFPPFMSLVFVLQTCFFERKICGTNKWEKFSPFFASPPFSPSPLLFRCCLWSLLPRFLLPLLFVLFLNDEKFVSNYMMLFWWRWAKK